MPAGRLCSEEKCRMKNEERKRKKKVENYLLLKIYLYNVVFKITMFVSVAFLWTDRFASVDFVNFFRISLE